VSSFFFGRATELERLRAIASDSVVVIYGLPGIGKTELAFRCAGELLATPAWHGVPLTRVIVDPEMAPNFHNYLLARLTGHGDLNPLDRLLDLLARDRHVLVIDDAHHAPVAVAALIDGIGRVRAAGRLIVTSRVELPFSTTPITVRIGPLEPAAARALVGHMAERLGVHVDDVDALVAQGRGSPLVLHHLVAGRGRGTGGDPIQATIAVLDSEAQRALVQLAAISGCSESRLAASQLVDDRTLTTLTEHLLVECGPDRVSVHGLVRDLVMKEADPQLVADSRRTVAGVLWDEFEQRHRPLLAVNSICLGLTLGDVDQAFARLRAASRTIASAGLDLLLLPILEGFADRGHADAALVVARIYLRMSRIDDAASLLDRLPAAQQSPRVLTMRATIAERVGDLPLAIRAFAEAITRTTSTRVWCLLGMRLAAVRAMAGDDAGAEAMLREIETTCPELGDIDLARLWWVRGIIDALHQDWPSVLAAVGKGRRAATRAGARDLDYLLLLLELLAASENADVERCEQIANEVGRAQPSQPVRERMTDLYLGVSQLTRGQVDASIVTLQRAYAELGRQRDTLLASLAGHYLGRALLIRGDADAAVEVLAAVANVAVACGQVHLVGPGNAYLARALMSTGRDEEARRLAEPLVANPCLQVSAEASAVLAYVAAFAGDIGGARRQIAVALARAGDREPLRSNLILDHAQLEMLGGDPDRMRTAALTVLDDHVRRSRPYARGRALIALATAELAVGNMPSAIDALAECETVALSHGMRNLRDRVTLLRGATAQARGSVLDRVPAEHRNGYLGLLRVLGLRSETVIVSSREGLVHTDADHVAAIALEHDILVDVSTGTLIGRGGQRVKGRDTAATILSRLADSAEPLSAERLYQLVWGGREYHPLRHRNTLYIALNRTRKVLREIGEEREVIQHDGLGWSIAPEIDVAVVRRDPRVTTSGVVELT
jgi:tetratricopeptide (TPR) repeat protein